MRLQPNGTEWLATGFKGNQVAVISLPGLDDPAAEDAWIAEIEQTFEQHAFDPTAGQRWPAPPSTAESR